MSSPLRKARVVPPTRTRADHQPMRLERRREAREAATGTVAATYSNGADRFGLTHLELVDCSRRGLGAISRTRIEPGMIVTMCPEGSSVPWRAARAVRCERIGEEFLIGLSMSALAAA